MSAFQFTLTTHLVTFMVEELRLGVIVAASLFATVQLAGIPGRVLLPWASDRYRPGRRVPTLAVVSLHACAALVALPAGTPLPAVMGILVALGLFGVGWFPLSVLQVAERAPRTSVASTLALATTLCMAAMALGPFVFGLVAEGFGYTLAWTLLIAPVLVTATVALRSHRRAP